MRWTLAFSFIAVLTMGSDTPSPSKPQPLFVWLDGPMELGIRYLPKIEPAIEKAITESMIGKTIPYYEIAWTDDNFLPRGEPLGRLRITGARVADEGQTLYLATDPHPRRAVYVLDWLNTEKESASRYIVSGVETTWEDGPEKGPPARPWVQSRLEIRPGEGGQRIARHGKPRQIVLRTSLIVPKGQETMVLQGNIPFEATVGDRTVESVPGKDQTHHAEVTVDSTGLPAPLDATLRTAMINQPPVFSARWKRGNSTAVIPASQLSLPWLPATNAEPIIPAPPFSLSGGDPKKGESVFVSEAAKCSSCHAVGGKGGLIGPSLDDLKGRDLAEVFFHIAEPSAKILPEFLSYTVARKGGEIAVGVVRGEGYDAIRVSDIGAKTTVIPKSEIEEMRPSSASTMPVGLPGALGEANMRNLLAFLTKKQ